MTTLRRAKVHCPKCGHGFEVRDNDGLSKEEAAKVWKAADKFWKASDTFFAGMRKAFDDMRKALK